MRMRMGARRTAPIINFFFNSCNMKKYENILQETNIQVEISSAILEKESNLIKDQFDISICLNTVKVQKWYSYYYELHNETFKVIKYIDSLEKINKNLNDKMDSYNFNKSKSRIFKFHQ